MTLDGAQLAAVGAIWKAERRLLSASFDGVSMMPTLAAGTPLDIACGDDAQPGDVVLFLHRGQPVVHRLLWYSRDGATMITRGDGNAIPDLPVPRDALIGRIPSAPPYKETVAQIVARAVVAAAPRASVVQVLWKVWGWNAKAWRYAAAIVRR